MGKQGVYEPYEPEDRFEQGLAEEHHTDIRVVEEHHAEMREAARRRRMAVLARCGSATLDGVGWVTRRISRRRWLRKHHHGTRPAA